MATIFYAWELGAGFGHIDRMVGVTGILERAGHRVIHAAKDLRRFASRIDRSSETLLQAPMALEPRSNRQAINYSDVLQMCGYTSADTVTALLGAWAALIDHSGADVVLLDHAPSAALAARGLGRPFVLICNGFEIPPQTLPMASLQPWKDAGAAARTKADRSTVAVINEAHARRGWTPIESVAELFSPHNSIIASPRILDHYGPREGDWNYATALTPGGSTHRQPWPRRKRTPHIFAYLSGNAANVAWLTALARDHAVLAYLRDLPDDAQRELKRRGVVVAQRPLDTDWACQNADLVLCHGGMGMLSACLRNACPVVVAPQHPEQTLSAYHISNAGIGAVAHPELSPDQLIAIVATVLNDTAMPAHIAAAAEREAFDPAASERLVQVTVAEAAGAA